jgi:hypothetical protein
MSSTTGSRVARGLVGALVQLPPKQSLPIGPTQLHLEFAGYHFDWDGVERSRLDGSSQGHSAGRPGRRLSE